MDLQITTTQLDVSVALNAYRLYKAGEHSQAIPVLQDILDAEPNNHQARLFLGSCFFKSGQNFASQGAFRYVFQNAADPDIRQKACLALQIVNSALQRKTSEIPLEFGALVSRDEKLIPAVQLDAVIN